LTLTTERFSVPEILFRPADLGLTQGGIAEAVAKAVEECPIWMQGLLLENIILVGGNSKLYNYQLRLEKEIRMLVPQEYKVVCRTSKE
jgi:actin-related protein 6